MTGSQLNVTTDDFHGLPFSVLGYHTWRNVVVAAIALKMSTGDSIIEVGANLGTETVSFADLATEVVAIEPDGDNLAHLRALTNRNISLIEAAASDQAGRMRFTPPAGTYNTGVGHLSDEGTQEVDVVTVDAVAAGKSVAAIFSDTEGHETHVLKGAAATIARCRPVIVVEATPDLLERSGSSIYELTTFLLDSDFDIRFMDRWGLSKDLKEGNWLAVPREADAVDIFHRELLRSALIPPRLNPLFARKQPATAGPRGRHSNRSDIP